MTCNQQSLSYPVFQVDFPSRGADDFCRFYAIFDALTCDKSSALRVETHWHTDALKLESSTKSEWTLNESPVVSYEVASRFIKSPKRRNLWGEIRWANLELFELCTCGFHRPKSGRKHIPSERGCSSTRCIYQFDKNNMLEAEKSAQLRTMFFQLPLSRQVSLGIMFRIKRSSSVFLIHAMRGLPGFETQKTPCSSNISHI